MSDSSRKWLRRAVTVVAVVVFAIVLRDGFESGAELPANMGWRLAVAIPLSCLGLASAAMSWVTLAGVDWRTGLGEFATSLPLRHLPLGGVGQVAGMSGLAIAGGTEPRRAVHAGPAFLVCTAAGASIVAGPVAFDPSVSAIARVSAGLAAVGGVVILIGSSWFLSLVVGWWHRLEGVETLPIRRGVAWSTLAALGAGAAFAVLLGDAVSPGASITGFSLAWLGGFLFVVAPAGLGAREAVMVALWPMIVPAEVVAVALMHRLSTLVGEGVVLLAGLAVGRSTTTQTDGTG